ncbi:MAG: hypothetical protein ABIJ16_01685, partial [Bacteroidota bacterium]
MKKLIVTLFFGVLSLFAFSQNVAINSTGAAPNSSAMLDVSSANTGMLIPRVALSATNNAAPVTAPATSLLVYNTATAGAGATAVTPGYYFWNGSIWVRVLDASSGDDWHITGNTGTTAGTNFIGTSDNVSLDIRTNNTNRIRVLNTGNVGIGTTTPSQLLHVQGNSLVTGNSYIYSATNGELHYGTAGLFGQATTFAPNSGNSGLWIEGSNDGESGGIFMNGNTMCLWSPGDADILRVYDEDNFAGGAKMVLSGAGYLGIGATAPGYLLTVAGTGTMFGIDNTATFAARNSGGTYESYFWPRWSDNVMYMNYGSSGFHIRNNSSATTMFMTNGNYVGIGTTSPGYQLELTGSFGFGNVSGVYRSRTETRNDAGLQGNAGAQSGFFETSAPAPAADWPVGAASWWHLIDCRHSNSTNNYALQIAGSFFDQNLYFRKTNSNPAQAWSQIYTSANGGLITCSSANYVIKSDGTNGVCSQIYDNGTNVGIGTAAPATKLHVNGSFRLTDGTQAAGRVLTSDANGTG